MAGPTSIYAMSMDTLSSFSQGLYGRDCLQYIRQLFEYPRPFSAHDHKNFFASMPPRIPFYLGDLPCNFSSHLLDQLNSRPLVRVEGANDQA